jgi:hypothetical protein
VLQFLVREDQELTVSDVLPKIDLPPIVPPTPEELARRRKLFAEVMRLREEMGPLGLTIEELLAEDEDDEARG